MKNLLVSLVWMLPYILKGQSPTDSVHQIRYLVAYSQAVENQLGSANKASDAIYAASEELYSALANSEIIWPVDLVRTVKINFIESGNSYQDLDRFRLSGISDLLRDRYRADLIILVLVNTDICGTPLVSNVLATESTAYCMVNLECMLNAYGLPHMVAHLFGAGHLGIYDSDVPDESAYSQGHAYSWSFVNSDCGFSTIMALQDEQNCCWGQVASGPIIPFFSNPKVKYSGVPTGVDSICDNASVIKNNAVFLDFFDLHRTWEISDTVQNADLALLQGINEVGTGTKYWIQDSAMVWFRAATRITLEPGFTAEEGTYFETILDSAMIDMR